MKGRRQGAGDSRTVREQKRYVAHILAGTELWNVDCATCGARPSIYRPNETARCRKCIAEKRAEKCR